jgi:hypothetical protein
MAGCAPTAGILRADQSLRGAARKRRSQLLLAALLGGRRGRQVSGRHIVGLRFLSQQRRRPQPRDAPRLLASFTTRRGRRTGACRLLAREWMLRAGSAAVSAWWLSLLFFRGLNLRRSITSNFRGIAHGFSSSNPFSGLQFSALIRLILAIQKRAVAARMRAVPGIECHGVVRLIASRLRRESWPRQRRGSRRAGAARRRW